MVTEKLLLAETILVFWLFDDLENLFPLVKRQVFSFTELISSRVSKTTSRFSVLKVAENARGRARERRTFENFELRERAASSNSKFPGE